jgi:hypothetical protein
MCKTKGCNLHVYVANCCRHADADWGPYCLRCIGDRREDGLSTPAWFACGQCGYSFCDACGSEDMCPECGHSDSVATQEFEPEDTCEECGALATSFDRQRGCDSVHFARHNDTGPCGPSLCGRHFVQYLERQGQTVYACKCLSSDPDNAVVWCWACGPSRMDVVCGRCKSSPLMVHMCSHCSHVDIVDVLKAV